MQDTNTSLNRFFKGKSNRFIFVSYSRLQQSQGSQLHSENASLSLRSIVQSNNVASSSFSSISQSQTQDILRDSWTTAELEQRLLAQQQQQWRSRESANGNSKDDQYKN
jgi:hypothetical protein